ncbi:hypothetical protein AVEN_77815-1 [Araneus ventricosus]|uniref:Uncharacterized protein n=1 Tax=Araneus ventricosus TaxID=182803 RepID=A0A4Y2GRX5_ARAVE|nr:hypothetical protein AVEN_77815-1 [Araneus ventricosus]
MARKMENCIDLLKPEPVCSVLREWDGSLPPCDKRLDQSAGLQLWVSVGYTSTRNQESMELRLLLLSYDAKMRDWKDYHNEKGQEEKSATETSGLKLNHWVMRAGRVGTGPPPTKRSEKDSP